MRIDKLSGQDVLLAEAGQQNLTVGGAVAIVGNVKRALGRLEAIGIGNPRPVVKNQAALPGVSIIFGQPNAQLHTPLVGVDALSVDRFDADPLVVHRILLSAGIVVLEGVELDRVAPGRYELVALPLKIAGGDGGPARAVLRALG